MGSSAVINRLYNDDMYRFEVPQPSYWEDSGGDARIGASKLEEDHSCDVAIIGGGYTALSAALHLVRDYDLDVRVLEAGHIGWGASGRNGGFCSIGGSAMELTAQLERFGVDHVRQYYQSQVDAVGLVASLVRDENIDTPLQGDSELSAAHSRAAFEADRRHAAEQFRLLGLDTEACEADEFRERFFDTAELSGGTLIRPTFGLHPLRYVRGLARAAIARGAHLHSHSEVIDWARKGSLHILSTQSGKVRARRVIVACNGFMPEHLHKDLFGVALPVISAIIVTRPLSGDELAAVSWTTECPSINTLELFNYFRILPDKRFMLGGRGTTTGSDKSAFTIRKRLVGQLQRQWPAWRDVDIEYFWHGLVCMTRRLTPCVGQMPDDPSTFFGFGYHGNGVNTSTWTGKQLADWVGRAASGVSSVPASVPVMMRGMSPAFPMPAMRLNYLRAALTWKMFRDWRSSRA